MYRRHYHYPHYRRYHSRKYRKQRLIRIGTVCICFAVLLFAVISIVSNAEREEQETAVEGEMSSCPYDFSNLSSSGFLKSYSDDTYTSLQGIDVSAHQEAIDWAKVKTAGIDFAMIRCGYRGYETGKVYKDEYFDANIQGALNNGIQVGVYFFSQAVSTDEAREEANFTLDCIRSYNITLPVVFDLEEPESTSRVINQTAMENTTNASTFLHILSDSGYTPMVYNSTSLYSELFEESYLQEFETWVAEYDVDAPTYPYDFQMWQYTSAGTVDGVTGSTDMDLMFVKKSS